MMAVLRYSCVWCLNPDRCGGRHLSCKGRNEPPRGQGISWEPQLCLVWWLWCFLNLSWCSPDSPSGPKSGPSTVPCIVFLGFPNVGKSSLINGLVGRKVVSVSRTPGHTRYFQTYFLTPSVKLCDCPGLIFPSLLPRQLQVCCGGGGCGREVRVGLRRH